MPDSRTRKFQGAICAFAFAATACGSASEELEDEATATRELSLTHQPIASKELFITDLSVVNDARLVNYKPGKWNTDLEGGFSFGRLIDNLSPVEKPSAKARSAMVMEWLKTWEAPQMVNGQTIAARPLIRSQLITPWKLASAGKEGNTVASCTESPASDATCTLSFAPGVVPFRLLAVVYRPDLRVVPKPGQRAVAGQGRFVFGALDAGGQPLQFTAIFEYMIPTSSSSDIKATAEKWHRLGERAFGPGFAAEVHANTLQFTKWNLVPGRNNGSALLQIRTNDVSFAEPASDPSSPRGLLWEMREFVIGASGKLTPDTVKQEPALGFSGSPELAAWATANEAAILANDYEVPETLGGAPFRAASSLVPFGFRWDLPGVPADVRDFFALNTCNGCHRNETATPFLHVKNRLASEASGLSSFLANELAPSGPRIADFKTLLRDSPAAMRDGDGRAHDDMND